MNYNETFLYAIKDKSSLPKGVTPSFFIGTPYPILEETENKLLTILSGGTVEVPEEFVLPMQPLDCRMLLYTKKGCGTLRLPKKKIDFMDLCRYNVFLHETVLVSHIHAIGGGVVMPNIKSAKKRVLIAKVNSERNKADKSALKTTLKKFEAAVAEGNREQADSAYQAAVQSIDKAAGKGILHKNAAARKKSQITLKMNKLA